MIIRIIKTFISLFYRKPDVIIGRSGPDVYLRRWYVIPRNPVFNIYLHNFLMSDIDKYLHTHSYLFNISILLNSSYLEHLPKNNEEWLKGSREEIVVQRYPWRPILRFGQATHRIELFNDINGRPKPVWTIFIIGPNNGKSWGFWCPFGLRDHKEFLKNTDETLSVTGRGCD